MKYLKEYWGGWAIYGVAILLNIMIGSGIPFLYFVASVIVLGATIFLLMGWIVAIKTGAVFKNGRDTNWTDIGE